MSQPLARSAAATRLWTRVLFATGHPLLARGGLAQPRGHPVEGVDGQLGVDGVLPGAVGGVVVHPAPLGHDGEDVLLVGPPVAELQAEPVVPVAVGELAVVGEVVVARGGDVSRDPGPDKVLDEGGATEYRHGPIVPSRAAGAPFIPNAGRPPGVPTLHTRHLYLPPPTHLTCAGSSRSTCFQPT
jgi:hypothetical protein